MKYLCQSLLIFVLFAFSAAAESNSRLSIDLKESRIIVSKNDSKMTSSDVISHVKGAIRDFYIISKDAWIHHYSHVAMLDASGYIEWPSIPNSGKYQWMLRLGGLATVTPPDGKTIFLAKEKIQIQP